MKYLVKVIYPANWEREKTDPREWIVKVDKQLLRQGITNVRLSTISNLPFDAVFEMNADAYPKLYFEVKSAILNTICEGLHLDDADKPTVITSPIPDGVDLQEWSYDGEDPFEEILGNETDRDEKIKEIRELMAAIEEDLKNNHKEMMSDTFYQDLNLKELIDKMQSGEVSEEALNKVLLRIMNDLKSAVDAEEQENAADEDEADASSEDKEEADDLKDDEDGEETDDEDEEEIGEEDKEFLKFLAELRERNKERSKMYESKEADSSSDEKKEKEEESTTDEDDPCKEIKEKLDKLVGVDEFRALCNEIMDVAPQLIKRNAKSVFYKQCYLFAIGDGQGLSSCLKILGELFVAAELAEEENVDVEECTLPFDEGEKTSSWERKAYTAMDRASSMPYRTVLCYDISDWIGHLTNLKFRDFLRKLFEKCNEDMTVVFRIPYLDKEVFARVQEALSDVFYTRTVTFPPLSTEDFRVLTEIELKKYDYKLTDDAWTYVEQKLSEEKSDGRFYGVNTLQKVICELVYQKEITNLHAKKDTEIITKQDAKAICNFPQEINADEMLNVLYGMEEVKERLKEVVAQIEAARMIPNVDKPCIHMRFLGNPGTGKTSIARILGKLLKEKGILRIGNFFEYSGRDFCGRYVGETAPKTSGICRDAYGSVLFIDEAYSLYRGEQDTRDFGREALDTLIAEMENHRDDMLVIMAGYPDEMETMTSGNVGLQSRMPYTIDFKNYTKDQLFNIFMAMMNKTFEYEPDVVQVAKEYFDNLDDSFLRSKEFSNGRFVRNLYERTWAKASLRCELNKGKIIIIKEDFLRSIADAEFKKGMQSKRRSRFGFNS